MTGKTVPVNRSGLVFCVSGPSGAGKGTVIRKVMEMNSGMVHSVSLTTRKPRPGEQDGVDYHFCSREKFQAMLEQGEILEHDIYSENYYGTPRTNIDGQVSQGIDVLLDITVPGSLSIIRNYPEAVTIFLMPPTFSELKRRLIQRGTEGPDEIRRRLEKASDEINKASLFTYCIINDDVTSAARSILAIAQAEHCRYERNHGLEITVLAR